MLISFCLENFKSFKNPAEISFVARRSDKTLQGIPVGPIEGLRKNDRLLPATGIYGANASGKTNFLLGLSYMRLAVLASQASWKAGSGTRFDPNAMNADEDGRFEINMVIDGIRYRYGFTVNRSRFGNEWLYSYPHGRERLLFRRMATDTDDGIAYEIEFGPYLTGDRRDHDSSFRRTRANSLYLSSSAQDNQDDCLAVQEWFQHIVVEIKVNVSSGDQANTSMFASRYSNFRSLLLPLLRTADPCIKDIVVHKDDDGGGEDEDIYTREFAKKHKVGFIVSADGKDTEIPFEKQSRGIKRLYTISLGLISALKFGYVCIFDELETSMHSQVASLILAIFQNRASNPRGAQLLFSTHETRLLNLQHLRRDQVWFCERDVSGSSSIFSLIEFSPRKDENFEAGYLRGRYGAVPTAGIDPAWLRAIGDDSVELEGSELDA